ncbi:hypothetical protein [Paracoccus litorisediminis]|uniref:Uncharacterized protein n=1 Tax=Paracoccus litorisediminis TaxID=2006130 RepID=A0A844HSM8_9RHOB|nr:hypothetical protein [Paracoccus litorisediminis]MTH61215.1 hypothetical protein [Paracoccus litorisediminis]
MSLTTVTVAVPEALMSAASHVVFLLGRTTVLDAYSSADWRDAAGNLYAVSSGAWTDAEIAGVLHPEQFAGRLEEFVAREPNLDPALIAQAQSVFAMSGSPVPADPEMIVAVSGPNALEILAQMGLSRIPVETEEPIEA